MSADIVVLIAGAVQLRAIRQASPFPGRVLYYTDSNLPSAFGTIRAHEPRVVALEIGFARTSAGREFVDRLQALSTTGLQVRVVSYENGRWSMNPPTTSPAVIVTPGGLPTANVVTSGVLNTRRVRRFPVVDSLAAVVDGRSTSLVDMSVMGAQVISTPALRPNQRLRITLPDEGDAVLRLTAHVAWSAFETSKDALMQYYRAGMEFTDAAAQALEEYCRRHCADEPLPGTIGTGLVADSGG